MTLLTRAPHSNRRSLFIAICIFLLLDFAILGINLHITEEVEADALAINIAGRQRMLSQQLTKASLQLHQADSTHQSNYRQEFIEVYRLFSDTLFAFKTGGQITDSRGKSIPFIAFEDTEVIGILKTTEQALSELKPMAERYIQGDHSPATIAALKSSLEANNRAVLTLMNRLTTRIEDMSGEKTSRLRLAQFFTFILALFNFAHIIRLFRKSSQHSTQLIKRLSELLDNTSSCLLIIDESGQICMTNALCREAFGYSQQDLSTLKRDVIFQPSEDGWFGRRQNGSRFAIELHEKEFYLDDRLLYLTTVIDISHHRDRERELAELANHDALTGLVNRRVFYDRLELEVAHADRNSRSLALFFIDLNGFKPINDTFGHAAGDTLLITIANRLKNTLRMTDTIARYGGDEFVIIVPAIRGLHESDKMIQCLQKVIEAPIDIGEKTVSISASIGITLYPDQCSCAEQLLATADAAMYEAKQTGQPYRYASPTVTGPIPIASHQSDQYLITTD